MCHLFSFTFFFFNDTATTEIYTLSLHDALPISSSLRRATSSGVAPEGAKPVEVFTKSAPLDATIWVASRFILSERYAVDRKSTRLNSSHANISYAVFCLKKKKMTTHTLQTRSSP